MIGEQLCLVGHDRVLAAGLLVEVMSLEDAHIIGGIDAALIRSQPVGQYD